MGLKQWCKDIWRWLVIQVYCDFKHVLCSWWKVNISITVAYVKNYCPKNQWVFNQTWIERGFENGGNSLMVQLEFTDTIGKAWKKFFHSKNGKFSGHGLNCPTSVEKNSKATTSQIPEATACPQSSWPTNLWKPSWFRHCLFSWTVLICHTRWLALKAPFSTERNR